MIKILPPIGTYEYAAQEDRSACRVRVAIPGHLRPVGGKRLVTNTRDISLSGFSAVAIARLNPGTRCWLTVPGMTPRGAAVVWWEAGVVGCAFDQLLSECQLETLVDCWQRSEARLKSQ